MKGRRGSFQRKKISLLGGGLEAGSAAAAAGQDEGEERERLQPADHHGDAEDHFHRIGEIAVEDGFGGAKLGAIRIDDMKFQFYQQPWGWPGEKVTTDMPTIVNLRQDPFERTPSIRGESLNDMGGGYMNDFYAREFWRFVLVQQAVAELAKTAIDYPPMQAPASFNLEAVKTEIDEVLRNKNGQ